MAYGDFIFRLTAQLKILRNIQMWGGTNVKIPHSALEVSERHFIEAATKGRMRGGGMVFIKAWYIDCNNVPVSTDA